MPLEGQQLGRYRLLRLLGSGSIGEVYLAEDIPTNRQVAIKVIWADLASYPNDEAVLKASDLFQREMRAATALDHPHILPFFDFGEEIINQTMFMYMVMPFRQEGSLADWLQRRNGSAQFSPQEVVRFVRQAASALQHAHDHKVIHQNVKPSNFLMRTNKELPNSPDLLLADFGIARLGNVIPTTSKLSVSGTAAYMAPEQWDGEAVPATDQYALAIMAYQLLTGHLPFLGNPELLKYLHRSVQPQPPSTFNPQLPKDIDVVILQALAKHPKDRFVVISAFARAFHQALPHITVNLPNAQVLQQGAPLSPSSPSLPRISPIPSASAQPPLSSPSSSPSFPSFPAPPRPDMQNPARGEEIPTLSPLNPEAVRRERSESELPSSSQRAIEDISTSKLGGSSTPATPNILNTFITRYQGLPKARQIQLIVLIGLLLLIILSTVLLYTASSNSTAKGDATATAQAKASSTSVSATRIARAGGPLSTYPFSNRLQLNDPLSDNGKGYKWQEGSDESGSCVFTQGAYHVSLEQQNRFHACIALATSFSNFTYEVQMKIIMGDCGGLIFRRSGPRFYYFRICQDGSYVLIRYTSDSDTALNVSLRSGIHPAIHKGLNQANMVAVVARGSKLDLYVNGQRIDGVRDSSYTSGQIGVVAKEVQVATEVVFSGVRVWAL